MVVSHALVIINRSNIHNNVTFGQNGRISRAENYMSGKSREFFKHVAGENFVAVEFPVMCANPWLLLASMAVLIGCHHRHNFVLYATDVQLGKVATNE